MENIEKKDKNLRKCPRCKKNVIPEGYKYKTCEKCREYARNQDEKKRKEIKEEEKFLKSPLDLFDFSDFEEHEQKFLEKRLGKYIKSEEYDLEDPVVEYQLYSILLEELGIRKLRLLMLVQGTKARNRTNYERQIDNAHKRLRDLWSDLNALIRQKLPDGSKKVSIAEQIKELEEKKKEIREQLPEKEKMKEVLKKRIEEEDI